ncbi:hypothetical protein ES704_03554 [subsurface metagenome]|jgi:hypothetical protein
MTKTKTKKDNKVIKSKEELFAGILKDNQGYILTIGVPGKGKLKIEFSFEKEEEGKIDLKV